MALIDAETVLLVDDAEAEILELGIIGDDGVEGIAIGNEQPAGMSYTEFQSYLKKLTGLGIMLNVCSKNEEAIAKQGFTDRKEAPLSVDDFIKKTQYTYFTREALKNVCDDVAFFASKEGLTAHAKSATIRFEEEK